MANAAGQYLGRNFSGGRSIMAAGTELENGRVVLTLFE